MDKDELILQSQYQEQEDEYAFDEFVEAEVEELRLRDYDNLVLLGNLLKEVTQQIDNKTPNLVKIKGMING